METIRIPVRYHRQLSRLTDNQRLFVFDALFRLASGEDVTLPDDLSGDSLDLIWRDCIQMERKHNKGYVGADCLPVSGTVTGTDTGACNEMKGKERKGKEVKGSESTRTQKFQKEVLPEVPPIPEQLIGNQDFSEIWREFREHRQEIGHPLTPRAEKMALANLVPFAAVATQAVRESIANGWQGVFPEKIALNHLQAHKIMKPQSRGVKIR